MRSESRRRHALMTLSAANRHFARQTNNHPWMVRRQSGRLERITLFCRVRRTTDVLRMALPSTPSRALVLASIVALVLTVPRSAVQPGDAVSFDCLTLLPTGSYLSESQSLVSPCPIAISVGLNYADGVRYTPGQTVRVQFRVLDRASVTAFFCRSSQVLLDTPIGVWNVSDGILSPIDCLRDADALMATNVDGGGGGGAVFDAFWTPPVTVGLGDMEIVCSVVSVDGKFWIWNSVIISQSRSVNDV